MPHRRRALAALLALASLAACGSRDEPAADSAATATAVAPSRRARDSAVAASRLPGAGGVGAALRASDSAAARAARAESIGREP
jgi:hypothetical protein